MAGAISMMMGARRRGGGAGVSPCTISGSLSGSGSASTITGTLRDVGVPGGNSGNLRFQSISTPGSGIEFRDGAGLWNAISNGSIIGYADLETAQARALGMTTVGWVASFNVYDDDTGTLLQSVTLTRT